MPDDAKVMNRQEFGPGGRLQATATLKQVYITKGGKEYIQTARLFRCNHTGTKFAGKPPRGRYALDSDVVRGQVTSCGCAWNAPNWTAVLVKGKFPTYMRLVGAGRDEEPDLSPSGLSDSDLEAELVLEEAVQPKIAKRKGHTPPNKKVGVSIAEPMVALQETRNVLLERIGYLKAKKDRLFEEATKAETDLNNARADLRRVEGALSQDDNTPVDDSLSCGHEFRGCLCVRLYGHNGTHVSESGTVWSDRDATEE